MPISTPLYDLLTPKSLHFGSRLRTLGLEFPMKPSRPSLLLLLPLIAACGCGDRAPSAPPPIERETFVRLTAEKMVIEEELRLTAHPPGSRPDSALAARRIDTLHATYGVSAGSAEETERWYKADAGRWRELQDLVAKRLEMLEQRERASLGPPAGTQPTKPGTTSPKSTSPKSTRPKTTSPRTTSPRTIRH